MEEIKGINGYFITKDALIFNKKRQKYLKGYKTKEGYIKFCIKNKNYSLHRLLAKQYIENPLNKIYINHKNGIKHDNRLENLEWVTPKENVIHAWENNLCEKSRYWKGKYGKNHNSSKEIIQLDMDGNLIAKHKGIRNIAKQLNIKYQSIIRCAKGLRKSAYGYKWKYA